uniref:Sodium channel protein Nach n=1 Tax=Heliothis virescens TaxID=7102 RepID=A0A2A4JRC0_HELVI
MSKSKISETIQKYFKTTTLHGFKYLCSVHCGDRVCWAACCCASACCAGVLCAVLWARFLSVPALLALRETRGGNYGHVPTIALCPQPASLAQAFLDKLSLNTSLTRQIPLTLTRLLTSKQTSKEQLLQLDELLASNNLTLGQVMMNYTPNCDEHTKRCRYQRRMLPCENLFEKELTYWGVCCVMQPKKLSNVSIGLLGQSHTTQMVDVVLQSTNGFVLYGCQLITYYEGEEFLEPQTLSTGAVYLAQLRFTSVPESPRTSPAGLLGDDCVHELGYTKTVCMRRCAERACGCRDPLQSNYYNYKSNLPICSASRLSCLRFNEYKEFGNLTCYCMQSCKKITSYMVLESSPITFFKDAIDPLYSGLNNTPTIVLNLRINVAHSREFLLNPTETWLTLLSSLGGVFNMFLGVGLFSALEFLYLIIAQLPVAIRKSSEIDPTAQRATPRVFR